MTDAQFAQKFGRQYWQTAAQYSIEQALIAIKNKNVIAYEQHLNVIRVADQVLGTRDTVR